MTEQHIIDQTEKPPTRASLAEDFRALGLKAGQTVLMHSALSKLGWVVGGPVAVVQALLDVLGEEGTLMVPAQSSGNSDPENWSSPPVPPDWWPIIRDNMPAYDPETTPTRQMGAIADTVMCWPGNRRSDHPQASFSAVGAKRDELVGGHTPIEAALGDKSPLAALYDLDGHVLLLGVGHGNNTSLHLAEHRAQIDMPTETDGAAVLRDGQREWVVFQRPSFDDEDFESLGIAYELEHEEQVRVGPIGQATARLLQQRPLVDFGVDWLEANRPRDNGS